MPLLSALKIGSNWVRLTSLVAGLSALWPAAHACDAPVCDSQAKAEFVFGFPKYVEWPASAFESRRSAIRICVLGDEKMTQVLTAMAAGKTIAGRPIQVHNELTNALTPHLVFISSSQRSSAGAVLRALQSSPTLTVADFDGFIDLGGMIGLGARRAPMKFHVNLTPASRAGLTFSAKMLASAGSVRGRSR